MPATPNKNAKGGGSGVTLDLPYSYLYVASLKLGFTTRDLKKMPYRRLLNMFDAYNSATYEEEKPKVRQATQADFDWFAKM